MKLSSSSQPFLVWMGGALFVMFQFMLQGSPSVMLHSLIIDLKTDVVGVGFLTSSFFYTYVLFQVPAGILVDRFGPRKSLLWGMFFLASSSLLFGLAQTVWVAKWIRMLMGFVSAVGIVSALKLASSWFSSRQFPLLVGLTELLCMLGGGLGAFALAELTQVVSWRIAMMITAGLGYILGLFIFCFCQDTPLAVKRGASPISWKKSFNKLLMIFSITQVWINGVFAALMFAVLPAFASLWAVPYLRVYYSISNAQAALMAGLVFLGAGVGSPLMGWLSEVLKMRKGLMLMSSLAATLLSLTVFFSGKWPLYGMIPMIFLIGFFSTSYVLPFANVSDLVDESCKGMAMGFTNMMCLSLGAPLLQPFIGYLLKQHGGIREEPTLYSVQDYSFALLAIPLSFLLAFIMAFSLKETECKKESASH